MQGGGVLGPGDTGGAWRLEVIERVEAWWILCFGKITRDGGVMKSNLEAVTG